MLIAQIEQPPYRIEFPKGDLKWLATVFNNAQAEQTDATTFLQGEATINGKAVTIFLNLARVVYFAEME